MHRRHLMHAAFASAVAADLADVAPAAAVPAAPARPARPPAVIAADGTQLAVRDWGEGPTVLFVNAWACPMRMWDLQVAGLTQAGVRCVTFDRRGHGRSQDPGRGYDMDTLASDLACVIEQLGLAEVTLVGHSMGAAESIRYLARLHGGQVRRAVLLAPAAPFLTQTADNPFGAPAEAHEQLRAAWVADFPKWLADNAAPFYTPATSPETVAAGVRMLLECPLPVALACNRALTSTDLRVDCRRIRTPTLVVHGDADASAPLEATGRRVAALVPGARLEVVQGAPHGLFTTHAELVNAAILAAVRS
jgi:pimeloyl-ACP methyl ester carboxylesterase